MPYYVIDDELVFIPKSRKIINTKKSISVDIHTPAANCLHLLIERNGEIVSQPELYHAGWGEKSIELTTSATYYQCFVNLRKQIKKTGYGGELLKTIPRTGMRMDAAIQYYDDECGSKDINKTTAHDVKNNRSKARVYLAAVISFIAVMAFAANSYFQSEKHYIADDYVVMKGYPNCIFIRNPKALSSDNIHKAIDKMALSCSGNKKIYLSIDWDRTVVFQCDGKSNKCDSITDIPLHE